MASNPATNGGTVRPESSHHPVRASMLACIVAKTEIDRPFRLGVAAGPAGEVGPASASGALHDVEMRARRTLEARIRFISHPSFDDSTVAGEILGPMPGPHLSCKAPHESKGPEGLSKFAAESQGRMRLTREQEVHLFRKMNFLKYQAAQIYKTINPSRACSADLDRVEELLREAGAIRNRIIGSYFGLVVSIVKKCLGPCDDFFDLVSEANLTLIQASERFDFGRGVRFSTYATWAITNEFARRIPKDRSHRVRFATGREQLLQALTDHRESNRTDAIDQEIYRNMVRKMLGHLDGREQTIIVRRVGLAGDKQTLVQVARELGLSKERVRQLESRALDKLRSLAKAQRLDPVNEPAY